MGTNDRGCPTSTLLWHGRDGPPGAEQPPDGTAAREPERDAAIYRHFTTRRELHEARCGSAVEALDCGGAQQRLGASPAKTLRLQGIATADDRSKQPAR
jgi:hypothetical protein